MVKLQIHGIINRECEICNKVHDCCSFIVEGVYKLLCSDCMLKEYGHKEKRIEKREIPKDQYYCRDCKGMTMRETRRNKIKGYIRIKYECQKCNKVAWRKKKHVSELLGN